MRNLPQVVKKVITNGIQSRARKQQESDIFLANHYF